MSERDPFPREAFTTLLKRVPAYARLAWRLAREPLLSKARRMAVVAAAGYLASPIDAVPGVIPVLGQLDDLAVAIAAIRFALAGLDADRRRAHLEAVGLTDGHLGEDVRTLGTTTAWLVRAGARTGGRLLRRGLRVAGSVLNTAARTSANAGTTVGSRARRTVGRERAAQGRRSDTGPAG